jgi:hypothetical protein
MRPTPTVRDRFWCACYLRALIDSASAAGCSAGTLALLEGIGVRAVNEFLDAQGQADDLERMVGS